MRSRSITGSGVLAIVAAGYLFVSSLAVSDAPLLSPGLAASAALVAGLLLFVNQAYLIVRSVGYCHGRADGGRGWIARRRELVGKESDSSGRPTQFAKQIAFLTAELILSPTVLIAATISAAILLVGVLLAGLLEAVPPERAGLATALVPLAALVAVLVIARSVLAAILFPGANSSARRFVTFGRLPQHPPDTVRRSLGIRCVLSQLAAPGPSAILLAAAAVPLMVALNILGAGLGVLIGFLLLQVAVTNRVLYLGSLHWWRQAAEISVELGRGRRFPRGTNAPTARLLVDLVTPLGPTSSIAELGGVLADHRALDRTPVRWTVVTELDRVDDVSEFLRQLFELHGCRSPGPSVRVVAAAATGAGPKRNAGAREATAPFIAFIDSDDRVDLLRLVAAVNSALQREKALQSVHLFPFFYLNQEGIRLRLPGSFDEASIVHHHCARLWPSGLFRSGIASYPDVDFEDALLVLEMATTVDHSLHEESDTAFFTYADHRDASGRLTRSYKEATHLLRLLVSEALSEANTSQARGRKPSPRERALINTFVGRVAAEVAWERRSTLDVLRDGLSEFAPYREARGEGVEISSALITSSIEGIRRRSNSVCVSGKDRGLNSFIRDEIAAKVPRTTTLTAAGREQSSERVFDERRLSMLIGLMNADLSSLRGSSGAPTVFYNLAADEYETARRGLHFFVREPHFHLESDPSIPLGDVEIFDPLNRSRLRLGSFGTDRLMSSKLLRLWDRFYPSMTECEQARAQIVLQGLRITSQASAVRLIGTGPSSAALLGQGSTSPDVVTICCNSWVRQPDRMAEIGAQILTAADPIFHAGPSEYAHRFRGDLARWLRADASHLFITVSRDISVYLADLPPDVHDQVVAVRFDAAVDADRPLPLGTGRVQPFPNILTLLMLPLAEHFQPAEVRLYGFDGGAKGAEDYWKYEPEVNYSLELQQTVRDWHPEFFRIDYDQYRDEHNAHVDRWLQRLTHQGIRVEAAAASNIPAIDSAFRATHASSTTGNKLR